MSQIEVSATERGRVYVISLPVLMDVPQLSAALGATVLDPAQVDIVDVAELGELGLSGYLAAGMGVAGVDALALAAVQGPVALIRSAAFKGEAQVLQLPAGGVLAGVYDEATGTPAVGDLVTEAAAPQAPAPTSEAEPEPAPRRASDAAMSGRVATIALLVLFALVAVMVWIA